MTRQGHTKKKHICLSSTVALLLEKVLEVQLRPLPVQASALPHARIPPRGCPSPNTPTYRQGNSKTDEMSATKRRRKRGVHACNNLGLGLTFSETNDQVIDEQVYTRGQPSLLKLLALCLCDTWCIGKPVHIIVQQTAVGTHWSH